MTEAELSKPNRLAKEKSPYLLEHSTNPVDWYSWGEEALAKSKNDNKPIFLSIGYSTCHWCHQMARESFEDEKVAAFINKHFIPIKVDREERPEVDAYYMGAVQAMTGGGGWPLSVFLTPDLKAFYGGTYFPPAPRYGMPSFMQVLEFVANLWRDRRGEVMENSQRVLKAITPEGSAPSEPSREALDEGYASLMASFDPVHGGFGGAPKFPLPGSLSFLLRYYHRTGKELALSGVLKALDQMAAGGIMDHVGGGFHRYSTDRVWLVPHFEKMLYDNALLARLYTEAFQITRKGSYAQVVKETLGWITKELGNRGGGFYSALDADTADGEGTYYTWTPEEVERAVGPHDAGIFCRIYGVTRTGNFEGRNILHMEPGPELDEGTRAAMAKVKRTLYQTRVGRPRPAIDTKVLTSWNGLAISAFAFASVVFEEPSYSKEAAAAADLVLHAISEEGRLLRRLAGGEAALDGTLEDYAFFVQGLIDLFEATSETRWLKESLRLTSLMLEEFEDKKGGGFYLSSETVPARVKESHDGPAPSGNSVAALNLVRLAELSGDRAFRDAAERTLRAFAGELEARPSGHTTMLAALDLLLNGAREIVITAPKWSAAEKMKAEVFRTFMPDKVLLVATRETFEELSEMSILLKGRRPGAKARAFVCENFACKLPADTVEVLASQLAARKG
jgi:uncharacterized protein YyaL (SSP411 family)